MGRPPFVLSRETERAAVDRATPDPHKRELLYQMVDAVTRIRDTGKATAADLAPFLTGLEATDEAVWGRAAGWLGKIYLFLPEIPPALDKLSNHSSATVRWHFCVCLNELPAKVALPYLRRFLSDRSARVRESVLTAAVQGNHRELLPDFDAWHAREKDAEVKIEIAQAIALIGGKTFVRDGMEVRKLPNGDIEYVPIDKGF